MNKTLKYVITGVVGVIVGIMAVLLFVRSLGSVGGATNFGGSLVVDYLESTGQVTASSSIRSTASVYSGGSNSTTTSAGTIATGGGAFTLIASDIVNYSSISANPIIASTTWILPASTTLTTAGWLPNAGDSTNFVIYNATSSVAVGLGLKGGTGSLLKLATTSAGTSATIATTTSGDSLLIRAIRKADTDILFIVSQFH
jgi:hypothetical protein